MDTISTDKQMDSTTTRLVEFALGAEYRALDVPTVHACKQRLIDTFAGAMGAYDEPLSAMARALARRCAGTPAASVWGSDIKTTPEAAAFANGTMLRFLDISDTYMGLGGGHPSDMLAGILAVAESVRADGASVINAMTVAYDVYCSLNDAVDIGAKGWDQTLYGVLGTVLGVGKLMRLSREQMGNAVSLALTPNMALRQTRQGDLSSWKGCAGANATRNAVFAAVLAQEGFTGPAEAFEGKQGLWNVLGRFEWKLPAPGDARMVTQTNLKSLPVCYHGQSAVLCALELQPRVNVAAIREVHVEAYRGAVTQMGGEPSRWAPTTRETADHSLPYTIAIALLDGAVTVRSFGPQRFTEPAVVDLMRKVKVTEDAKLTAQYPESSPSRVTITLTSGEVYIKEMRYPKGHVRNAMDDHEIEAKFHDLCGPRIAASAREDILRRLWNFERVGDIETEILGMLAV